jgi:hypothetical protein
MNICFPVNENYKSPSLSFSPTLGRVMHINN